MTLDPVQSEAPPEEALAVAPEDPPAAADPPRDDGAALPVLEGRFVSVDQTGSITTWSATAAETFGFDRAEVAGQPLAKVIAPGSQETVRTELDALLAGGPARRLEIDAVDAHAREFPAALSLVPIGLASGYAFNALLQDLTKQALTPAMLTRLREQHADVLDSIRVSLEAPAAGEEDERVVGALVMFEDLGPPRAEITADEPALAPQAVPAETLEQLDEAKREAEQAWRDAQEAEARAAEAAGELEAAREEAERLRSELEALRGDSDAVRERADALTAELESANERAAERDSELERARAELERVRVEHEQAQDLVEERDRRLQELDTGSAKLAEELEGVRAELAEARERGEAADRRAEELAAELEAARSEASGDLAAAREKAEELQAALDAARTEGEDAQAKAAELESALDAARAEGREAAAKLDELQSALDAARADGGEATTKIEELQAALEAARRDGEEAAARVDELERELDAARTDRDGTAARLEEVQAAFETARTDGDEARAKAEELQAELDAARGEAADAKTAAEELRADLDGAKGAASDAGRRVEELTAELEAARTQAREAGASVEETNEAVEAARRQAEELRTRADDAEQRAEASAAEVETLRAELEAARSDADRARDELGGEAEAARSAAQEAAEEGERFRLAFDQAPIGMALTSTDGRFLRVNRSLCDLLGYDAERLLAPDPPAIVHDDDVEPKRQMAQRMLAGESATEQVETRYLHADGRILHVKETVSLARDAAGEPVHFVFQFEDVSERKQLEEAATEALDRDPVTGLFNRRRFEEELSRKIADAAHHGGGGAAVLLNLKDFDSLKGDLPEEAGEELLRTVASALRDHLRNAELLARLSGDEFAVLLPEADAEKAQSVAEELVQAIGPQVVKVGDKSVRITLSVGVALFDERDQQAGPVPVGAVGEGSDGANLPVPVGGRSSLAPADGAPVPPEHVQRALEDDLFLLYCQPVVDLRTSDITQYELLLRMADEEGNLILPRAFLQTAEESGLIRSIDQWVVRRAIRLIAEGARNGKHLRLEVNISGSSVDDPDLPALVEQELITTGADPSSLVLEVPEAVATSRHDEVKELAKRVRALGCRFAVDNFGSAVTSFRYIKDLPLDYLKLDGDLIATLPESRTDQLVVKAIVDIALGMGCQTIAEMVADDETLFLLRQQGVGFAQGYQVGRPQPVAEI